MSSSSGVTTRVATRVVVAASSVKKPVPSSANTILVSPRQKGNPVLNYIKNVVWKYDEHINADYEINENINVLFLSIRYHSLHGDYIEQRIKSLDANKVKLRILVCLIDVKDPFEALKQLTSTCLNCGVALLLAFSVEETARYVETLKCYERKPATLITGRKEQSFNAQIEEALTSVKRINKTDAQTLMKNFKNMNGILKASSNQLKLCPGFGSKKAETLFDLINTPFVKNNSTN